jgi:NADH dehydrogenase (ubiquinone) 1 beta subcomplex subunit 7
VSEATCHVSRQVQVSAKGLSSPLWRAARSPLRSLRPIAGSKFNEERELLAHPAWLQREKIRPEWRDFCSHMLLPLNRCRHSASYAPWKCETELHAWEECLEKE